MKNAIKSESSIKKTVLLFSLSTVFFSNMAIASFDKQDLKGGYAFRFEGLSSIVSVNESDMVATGQVLSDGAGNVTGHGNFRSAGITCAGNIKGTYNLEPNGTGILSTIINTTTPGCSTIPLNFAMILSDKSAKIDVVNSDNSIMKGQLTRQEKSFFKHSDLSGVYAMNFSGNSSVVTSDSSYTTGMGTLGSDGNGKIGGAGTLRSAGVACKGIFSGIYHVENDGTGSIVTKFTTTDPGCTTRMMDFSVALFKKGNGAEISSSENDYMAGSLNRQVPKGG